MRHDSLRTSCGGFFYHLKQKHARNEQQQEPTSPPAPPTHREHIVAASPSISATSDPRRVPDAAPPQPRNSSPAISTERSTDPLTENARQPHHQRSPPALIPDRHSETTILISVNSATAPRRYNQPTSNKSSTSPRLNCQPRICKRKINAHAVNSLSLQHIAQRDIIIYSR